MYDVAIIGTGPAGMSAALNLKIHEKNFIWIGSSALSEKMALAEEVLNYPGLPKVTGRELTEAYQKHIADMGIEISEYMVNSIMDMGDYFALLAGSEYYEAKKIILATGVVSKAQIIGESKMLGRGVSYCATCDGQLYKGRDIAVVCTSKRFEHEVNFLKEIAGNLHYFPQYTGSEISGEHVTVYREKLLEIEGENVVTSIKLKDRSIAVNGVFILRDSIAMDTLIKGLVVEEGHIIVDRRMETSIKGIYAAGDCTGRPYQYTKAVGEGNVAAHSVLEEL